MQMETSPTKAYFDHKTGYGVSKNRLRSITAAAGDLSGKSVLDVGCGAGRLGAYLREQGATRVVGCDIAVDAITAASQNLDHAFTYDVATDSLSRLCGEEKFDVVVATELIEHLFQPARLLQEVKSVLKPDGVFIVTTPNFLLWSNRLRMLFGQFQYTKTGLLDESHVHFFTYNTLHQIVKEEGLTVVAEHNVYHGKVPKWLQKHIPTLSIYQMVFVCKSK